MKTKNIFKTLALAMLMPAMLLTTACSNDDDAVNNVESTAKKGYELPVTVNVTRQGDDPATRASYNGSTRKLEFSTGDKLFVEGEDYGGAGRFAGTLDWVSEGTFSGTITTQNSYSGTADELFAAACSTSYINATLLPAGYETPGFLSITHNSGYNDFVGIDREKTFATSKATAVEQFSYERTYTYSSGFALSPVNAILNFTISGLTPNASNVAVSFIDYWYRTISGTVNADASGNVRFAVGVAGQDLNNCSLTVGGNAITLVNSSKTLTAGHIYNITRSAAPAPSYNQTKSINADDVTVTAGEHWLITGTGDVSSNFITIGDGATVTLDGVKINMGSEDLPCIKCEGSATIILKDGSTNQLVNNSSNYPALWIGDEGTTLTIQGSTGSLTVTSGRYCAGIGGGYSNTNHTCGNIVIEGGIIEATGGEQGAGIGSDNQGICGSITISGGTVTATATGNDSNGGAGIGSGYGSSSCGNIIISDGTVIAECSNAGGAGIGSGKWSSCGNISISGGHITATGGDYAAGIGGGDGYNSTSSCGDITIANTVTSVTATRGNNAPNSIGAGDNGTCGMVSIDVGANVTQN